MSLLNLPPELLYQVIEESMPEGFESLLLSCRYIYKCGESLIETHETRRRKWCTLSFRSNIDYMSAFSSLDQIANEPILARYVETAQFALVSEELRPVITFNTDRIKRFITESPYLRKAGVDAEEWAQHILFGIMDDFEKFSTLILIFVLTLLPNVKTLRLPSHIEYAMQPPFGSDQRSPDYYSEVWNVLQTIRRTIDESPEEAPLGKLTTLKIREPTTYDDRFQLRALSAFLVIPSLTDLFVTNCLATHVDAASDPFVWYYPNINSNLRNIELDHGCMDQDCVSQLLAHTPHLISFKFDQASKHHGVHYDWDAGAFVAAIGKHVGDQLEELAVTVQGVFGSVISGVTSMKEFKKLKSLELGNLVFCGPPFRYTDGSGPAIDGFVRPLLEVLPSSLENFYLFVHNNSDKFDLGIMKELFVGFDVGRPNFLPNLDEVEVRCRIDDIELSDLDELRACAESEGAYCNFGFDIQPHWKDTFYDDYY